VRDPARPEGVPGRLARIAAARGASLIMLAGIALVDILVPWQTYGFVPRGLVAEPCHLANVAIVLGAVSRWRGRPPGPWVVWTMLSAAVLIDLDHLPLQFGSYALTAGTPRPYFHAVWVVLLLAAAAAAAGRRARSAPGGTAATAASIFAGAAGGVAAHFLRDLATAPISLWLPVTAAPEQIPYPWYLGALFLIILVGRRPGGLRAGTAAAGEWVLDWLGFSPPGPGSAR